MFAFTLFIIGCVAINISDAAIDLDKTKQLFLDDFLIASMDNITREIHPIQKYSGNPVLWPSKEWEGKVALLYGSVLRDEGKYRMWYYGSPGVCYAESDDGITWNKPLMNLVEVDGRKTNIIISRDTPADAPNAIPYFYEIFGVHKDLLESDAS
ncbi:MAG: hypothetical protein ABIH23_26725, partial [bacterium]